MPKRNIIIGVVVMCDNGALVIAAMGFASEKIVKIAPMTMPI